MKGEQILIYESPRTRRMLVCLEGGFCAGSTEVENPNRDTGRVDEHETNTDFGYTFDNDGWD